jgi:hypothetical protein
VAGTEAEVSRNGVEVRVLVPARSQELDGAADEMVVVERAGGMSRTLAADRSVLQHGVCLQTELDARQT